MTKEQIIAELEKFLKSLEIDNEDVSIPYVAIKETIELLKEPNL